jgi:2,4-dienoyl-CoA reductase-like NADH-dependent reductase (Old Yellow Enzyme family)
LALTIFRGSSEVSPDLLSTLRRIDVSDDRIVPHFQEFARRIHAHGTVLMCQIGHMGRRTRWDAGNWLPAVAPSPVHEPEHRFFPKAMEDWDFTRILAHRGLLAYRG